MPQLFWSASRTNTNTFWQEQWVNSSCSSLTGISSLVCFFFARLCENLWHDLWEMENKSLNPVCVNNWHVFSWSRICSCYFGQTADGRIVNIHAPHSGRLSMPTFRGEPASVGADPGEGLGDCGRTGLSPGHVTFLSSRLLSLLLGPPCSPHPGPISSVLVLFCPPTVFRGAWACVGAGSDGCWSWCPCRFPSCLARLATAPAHAVASASPSPAAAVAARRGGTHKWWKLNVRDFYSGVLWAAVACLEPQCWVCSRAGSGVRCLFEQWWAVHTLEEQREGLARAALRFLNVFAFELLWCPYTKPLHGLLHKLPGCRQKRAVCVRSSKQLPSACLSVFIGRGEKGKNCCHLRNVSHKWQ